MKVDTTKIITPKGGTPTYVITVCVNDEVTGSIVFKSKDLLDTFMTNYQQLEYAGFGALILEIDTENNV
jgi:hypothetical protein